MILFNNHLSIGINKPLPIKRNDTPEVLILEEDKQLPEQGEKFDDVYAEMRANVPDSTSTIEEKELALQYIDRLLNCGDITDELKKYWTNKKEIIQMEMTTIKNIEKQGTELNSDDLFKELRQFYNVFGSKESFGSADQRIEYGIAYFNSVISYYSLILQCDDISEADKKNYEKDLKSAEESLKGLKEEQETLRKQEEQEEQGKNSPRLAQLHIKTPFLFIKS